MYIIYLLVDLLFFSLRGQFSFFNKENQRPEGSFKINLRVCKEDERRGRHYSIFDNDSREKTKPQCSPKPNQVVSVRTSNQTATGLRLKVLARVSLLCCNGHVVLGTRKCIHILFSGTSSWKSLSFSERCHFFFFLAQLIIFTSQRDETKRSWAHRQHSAWRKNKTMWIQGRKATNGAKCHLASKLRRT